MPWAAQFFVTLVPTPHLDGKHVVFGRLLRGQQLLRQMEARSWLPSHNSPPCHGLVLRRRNPVGKR